MCTQTGFGIRAEQILQRLDRLSDLVERQLGHSNSRVRPHLEVKLVDDFDRLDVDLEYTGNTHDSDNERTQWEKRWRTVEILIRLVKETSRGGLSRLVSACTVCTAISIALTVSIPSPRSSQAAK